MQSVKPKSVKKVETKDLSENTTYLSSQLWRDEYRPRYRFEDKVMPSLEEISYCVKNNLVNPRELILYKLILDHHEAVLSQKRRANIITPAEIKTLHSFLIPAQYSFYKQLSAVQIESLLCRMVQIQN